MGKVFMDLTVGFGENQSKVRKRRLSR